MGLLHWHMKQWFLISLLFILASSCFNQGDKSYEELEPGDIPAEVTWEEHIEPIFVAKCVRCHDKSGDLGANGDYDFTTYQSTASSYEDIEKFAMVQKIMPPGSKQKLTPKQIALLKKWKATGFLEN